MQLCLKYPIVENSSYAIHSGGLKDMYLSNVWKPNLSVTGIDGIPATSIAGNAVRSHTALRISMRLPPVSDPEQALKIIIEKLTSNVPYNA
jgi:Peptidase dimerisation domain